MNALVFVDTNVLIYALDAGDPQKQQAARAWRAELWRSRRGRVSFQVLQEFYVQVTRKWPAAQDAARAEVRDLLAWRPVNADAEMIERAWKIQDRYGFSFWDALVVAATRFASCPYLLTEDLQAGQNLDGVLVVNPFRTPPSGLPTA
jgi:predicted nucleic acid-binding protein